MGEPGRGPGASRDEAPARSAAILAALLLGALLLRLVIAYVLFPGSGFKVDIGSFASWGDTLARYGPGGFYTHAGFADYTPGYLYVLWLYRGTSEWFGSHILHVPALAGDVKLPGIAFDLAVGWLIYRGVRSWKGERAALIGAALYLFNPVTWYESALWGQVDAVGTFFVLASVLLLVRGWSEAATGAAVLATLIKPQYGIVALVVGFVLLGRHLVRVGRGPVPVPRHPLAVRLNEAIGGWFVVEQGPWRLVSSAAVGLIVLFVVITPFDLGEMAAQRVPRLPVGGDLGGLLVVIGQAVGQYHYLTVNAHNLWALVGPTSLAWSGLWTSDLLPAFAGIPYVVVGTVLLAVTITFLAYQFVMHDGRRSILVTATVLAIAVFAVPTRVHERYLFPAFALGALLAAGSPRWRWWYVALALVNVANLHANLTNPLYGTANVIGLPFGAELRGGPAITTLAVAHSALFAWALWQVRPAVDEVRGLFRRRGTATESLPGPPGDDLDTSESPPPAEEVAPLGPAPEAVPEVPWREVVVAPPGWRTLRDRLLVSPIRPDRSPLLHGEGGGRLDRLDALAIVLILVVGLSLRAFRADQPYAMVTLDEVYHARTATEFLQDWRYGMPHGIYEYTHPHLAKYLMALGIVALGNDRVVATSELGTPVRSVALERRYATADRSGRRAGDRLFLATGRSVRVIDLRTGADEAGLPVAATAVAVDPSAHVVYAGGADGTVWSLDTATIDRWRDVAGGVEDFEPHVVAHVGSPIDRLWAVGADRLVVASGDALVALDPTAGRVLARRAGLAIAGAVTLDAIPTAVVHPESLAAVGAEARTLADLLGLDAAVVESTLAVASPDPVTGVRVLSRLSADQRSAVQAAIDDGRLTATEVVDRVPLVAAVASGLALVDTTSLETIDQVPLDAPALGLDRVGEGGDRRLYVARADAQVQTVRIDTGSALVRGESLAMPGPVRDVRWDPATNLVHVLGESPAGGPTIYVIEPHGNAVFADAALPFEPVAWTLDVQPDAPSVDRERALAFAGDGRVAGVDVGRNAFAWRFPGILLGVLMAAAIYLLARILFRRRSVAVLATVAMLTDGMLFAHSRDAMNDAYVGFFIVAALTVLAWLWIPEGRRNALAVAVGLPVVGVLLGLGLASKWVAIFAMGAAALLVLLRSALGRLIALMGMVVLTGLLGNLALATGNLTFALLMLALTLLMAVGLAWRPMLFSREELRLAAAAPALVGLLLLVAAALRPSGDVTVGGLHLPTLAGGGLLFVALGVAAWAASRIAIAKGWLRVSGGPRPPAETGGDAPSPPPEGWLRPGAGWGVPTAYAVVCLLVLPLVVYVASYIPWTRPWDEACSGPANSCPQIIPATIAPDGSVLAEGWPAGHRGETLLHLTIGMYDYHNDLRATHPASSPWWAWPFDLKPVWLFQEPHGAGTTAVIFDVGNMVTFWLAVPAIGFGLWQAWRRRSRALAFVGIAFLALWLGWARVDRVSFQYHYYTALPFAFLLLAYFLAELWHGPSARTWMLARAAAAAAILAPGALWLLKDPLCTIAGVTSVSPNSYLCTSQSGTLAIPAALIATAVVLVVGLALFARELILVGRTSPAEPGGSGPGTLSVGGLDVPALARMGAILVGLGLAVTVVPRFAGSGSFSVTGSLGQVWVIGLLLLAIGVLFAWLALDARDPRRAVLLIIAAAALWFVAFYPYVADLALPANAPFVYQRILPTFDYSFQFAVNRDPSPKIGILDQQGLVLMASVGVAAVISLLLVRGWRLDRLAFGAPSAAADEAVGAQRP